MRYVYVLATAVFLSFLAGCSQVPAQQNSNEIHISAASSLASPLDEIKVMYEKLNPGTELVINYGGSGTLVNQLEQGAPADLVVLASSLWMERAVEQEIVKKKAVEPILSNRLVLAAPEESDFAGLEKLTDSSLKKLAIGDPASVPVGNYTKQALTELGHWKELQDKAVFAKSARQVAVYLESGNVDAGFIFQSDLEAFPAVTKVEAIQESLHAPIVYPAAPVSRGENTKGANKFLNYLTSEDAGAVFSKYGFEEVR